MKCREFDRWLDDGMPEAGATASHTHAAACARCDSSLAAARELDALLEAPAIAAPPRFTGRVMARVAQASAARVSAPWTLTNEMPWWVRAAADPATLLAAAVAALVVWRADALLRFAAVVPAAIAGAWRRAPDAAGEWLARGAGFTGVPAFADPAVQLGLALALASLLTVASVPLYRWCERAVGARPARAFRRA